MNADTAELERGIANVLDDMRADWIEGLLPKLTEFVIEREQAAYRRALQDAADYALAVDRDGEAAAPDAAGLWDDAHAALTDVLMNRGAAQQIHEWLRDRAAAVGVTGDTGHDHETCGECCHQRTQARIEAVNEERADTLARHIERPYE